MPSSYNVDKKTDPIYTHPPMATPLQIGDRAIPLPELPDLLHRYRLLPQLARELVLEQELASFAITEEEQLQACKKFYQQNQLTSEEALGQWLQQQRMSRADLSRLIDRELRLGKFKTHKWEVQVESYFCQRKSQIDQVIFSMVRVKDVDVAEELFFRLQSEEASFVEVAPRYSDGLEAKTKGISGPVELGKLDPSLAMALSTSRPGEVLAPIQAGNWWLIVQLEEILPAQLDEGTRQRLTEELYTLWLNEQVQQFLARADESTPAPSPV
jgi:parvulin-like peptidyl-prolyl isomerase